ncbi:MAG: phosphoribosylformylglycinamidine synthase subunit PurS [Chloroflexi bacterium]|nr:MAG: phosphoribosylformylglycinamidine synthase subunit PurS [Chloroflexota bacterium]TME17472.1 MAG: phosphoribosylformylglycinamidine synthase subunit PurS [Chloroflexota bacterium]TME19595.1 MAG: phosphoribosylformylglycinamidine synthase subunit PurS [Chloroflexota bacterium]
MVNYLATVVVTLKQVVNDPQGLTVKSGLRQLGFDEVEGVRVGKHIEVRLTAEDEKAARTRVSEMCRRLLANHVIEDVRFQVEEQDAQVGASR